MDRNQITFVEISHGSSDWREVLEHRDRILRHPLGLTLCPEDLANEDKQRHFILRSGENVVAGLITCPPLDRIIRIRQMWVHEDFKRTGLGRRLLFELAMFLKNEGIHTLTLNARKTVRGFYERSGYQVIGESFIEVGIPHYLMIHHLGE